MPYRPSKEREQTATTTIPYEDDEVTVTYRKKLARTAAVNLGSEEDRYAAPVLREGLEQLIVSWDVLDEDDQPLPATSDVTRHFDIAFLIAVFAGIMEHALPGEDGGATSPPSSLKAGTSANARKNTR